MIQEKKYLEKKYETFLLNDGNNSSQIKEELDFKNIDEIKSNEISKINENLENYEHEINQIASPKESKEINEIIMEIEKSDINDVNFNKEKKEKNPFNFEENEMKDAQFFKTENKQENDKKIEIETNKNIEFDSKKLEDSKMNKSFLEENKFQAGREKIILGENNNMSLPLRQAYDLCLNKIIEKQYSLTNKALMQIVFEKYDYFQLLQFFKKFPNLNIHNKFYFSYFLCYNGEKIDNFIESVFKEKFQVDISAVYQLNQLFEDLELNEVKLKL